jgi:hypothetical protein
MFPDLEVDELEFSSLIHYLVKNLRQYHGVDEMTFDFYNLGKTCLIP